MKKFLIAASCAALGSITAHAAGTAPRPYTKAPAMERIYNWSGFYIGASGGYGELAKDLVDPFDDLKGGFAGGQLGYNWQFGAWVLGVEADAHWANIHQTLGAPGASLSSDIHSFGTVRGRVGYAFDNLLLYGTGGFIWAQNTIEIALFGQNLSDTRTHTGWTIGGGLEYGFTQNWSAKAEYLYSELGSENYFSVGTPSRDIAMHTVKLGLNYRF